MNGPERMDRKDGEDAVCFAAGIQGPYFAAGTIHAYLAADRNPPVVVAGISAGSVTAAAMYKSYADLQSVHTKASEIERETARWRWFRSYLEKITHQPLSPIWQAIPNPVDFFSETLPVEDLSCPEELKLEETEARIHYHRLVRLGGWLAGISISVGSLVDAVVRYVRWKERYALWLYQGLMLLLGSVSLTCLIAWHVAWAPQMQWRRPEYKPSRGVKLKWRPNPLFGWGLWLGSLLWVGIAVCGSYMVAKGHGWWAMSLFFAFVILPPTFAKLVAKSSAIHRIFAAAWPQPVSSAQVSFKDMAPQSFRRRENRADARGSWG